MSDRKKLFALLIAPLLGVVVLVGGHAGPRTGHDAAGDGTITVLPTNNEPGCC